MLIAPPPVPVPFYSQFENITLPYWQGKGCGITDLTMLINYYKPDATSTVDEVLSEGITENAYIDDIGWSYQGLIDVAQLHGLGGFALDLKDRTAQQAFNLLNLYLKDGPVIASVHYKFDPKSAVPHLIVVTGVEGEYLYYNDPAADAGQKKIPLETFLKAWKKRFIVIRPGSAV